MSPGTVHDGSPCLEARQSPLIQWSFATWTRIVSRARPKQAKGALKEAAGKALGDSKLVADGKSDKVEGKFQNAIGGLKDALQK